jgi:hypothetical protein
MVYLRGLTLIFASLDALFNIVALIYLLV